ncbi:MAG: glycosyltransferase 87 family protein [Candidatus Nanopelagicales bacterium]
MINRWRPSAPAVIVGWFATRALILLQLLIWADNFLPDVRLYSTWTILLADRQFPVGDAYWQYPPGAGVLFALSRYAGPDPVFGFVVLAFLADLALLLLLLRAGRGQSGERRFSGAWAWVIGGLAVGPVLVARFDIFPTVFAVAAVLLATKPVRSGVMAAIGALLKVWPILMLAVVSRRQLPKAVIAAIVTGIVGVLAINAWASGGISFLGEQSERGLQIESVGALPYMIAGALGFEQNVVLRYGAYEFVMSGVGLIGLAITAIGLLLFALIAVLRLAGRLEQTPPGDIALALILIAVASSRVFSPQYDIWIVGLGAACIADPRTRLRKVVIALLVMSAVTSVIFPWAYGSLMETAPYAVALQVIRIVLLVGCTFVAVKSVAFTREKVHAS